MELLFLLLAATIGFSHGGGTGPTDCDVANDLAELVKLFPGEEYDALVRDYSRHDASYKLAQDYLDSQQFADLFAEVRLSPEYQAVMARLKELGFLGVLDLGERFQGAPRAPSKPRTGTGFHGLVKDVIAALPHARTEKLLQAKMATHPCFKSFVDEIQGLHFQALLTKLENAAVFREMTDGLSKHGVDLHDVYHLYEHVLGFEMFSTVEQSWDHRVKTEL